MNKKLLQKNNLQEIKPKQNFPLRTLGKVKEKLITHKGEVLQHITNKGSQDSHKDFKII